MFERAGRGGGGMVNTGRTKKEIQEKTFADSSEGSAYDTDDPRNTPSRNTVPF